MGRDLAQLSSYVRFYLTVTAQLEASWAEIARSHSVMQEALKPHAEALAPVGSSALSVSLGDAPAPSASLSSLWKPSDKELSGLCDVYEVVGRFSFQGDDDANLARVTALVVGARSEIHALRSRLDDLGRLPELARATGGKLAGDEARAAQDKRAARARDLAPLTDVLRARAKQTGEAMRAVPLPDFSDVTTAADTWQRYVTRMDQVYGTCLPYLRKALASLYELAGLAAPASWPDHLPFVPDLPSELLAVPAADSAELAQAKNALAMLDEEASALTRVEQDDLGAIARYQAELAASGKVEEESRAAIDHAIKVLDHAVAAAEADRSTRTIASYEQQRADRVASVGRVEQKKRQIEAAISALGEELGSRAAEISAREAELAELRTKEPVLWGKEEWRAKVAVLESDIERGRAQYVERKSLSNQLGIELSAVAVEVQTEEEQGKLVERWIEGERKKRVDAQERLRLMTADLGAGRPVRPLAIADAEAAVEGTRQARAEIVQRMERLLAETRRAKEDGVRIVARQKQLEGERQRWRAVLEGAAIQATQGRDAALRRLAEQRRSAVEAHVGEVLGALEQSLASVDAVFVEPVAQALTDADAVADPASARVRAAADAITPVVAELAREVLPKLLAEDAMLSQVQREFCEAAPAACVAAFA